MEPRQTPVLFSTMNLCWRHAGKYQWMQMHAFLCAEQSWSMSPTIEQWLFTTQTTRPRALPLWPSTLTSQPVRPPIHLAGLEISFALLRKWRNGTVCVCVCVNDVWFVVFLTWLSDHFFLFITLRRIIVIPKVVWTIESVLCVADGLYYKRHDMYLLNTMKERERKSWRF